MRGLAVRARGGWTVTVMALKRTPQQWSRFLASLEFPAEPGGPIAANRLLSRKLLIMSDKRFPRPSMHPVAPSPTGRPPDIRTGRHLSVAAFSA